MASEKRTIIHYLRFGRLPCPHPVTVYPSRAREIILGYPLVNPNRPNILYSPSLYELGSRRVTQKMHRREIFRQNPSGSFENARMLLIKPLHRNRGPTLTRFAKQLNARILLFTFSNDFCILRKRLSNWLRSFWLRLDSFSSSLRRRTLPLSLYSLRTWASKLLKYDAHLSVCISRRAFLTFGSWAK